MSTVYRKLVSERIGYALKAAAAVAAIDHGVSREASEKYSL